VFDAAVHQATCAFQASHLDPRGRPLVVDGVVGPLTWWALRQDRAAEEPGDSGPSSVADPAGRDSESLPPGGTPAGRAALAAALAEMRAGAREQGGNNRGPWVEKYLNGMVDPPANWCAGFVSWCYAQAPVGLPFTYSLGARHIGRQFADRGWAYEPGTRTPAPGDIVVWSRGDARGWTGHIGLVHHVAHGILYTIEGNRGGYPAPVARFDYVLSRMDRLLGFGRVP
jgi:hypothetical protein